MIIPFPTHEEFERPEVRPIRIDMNVPDWVHKCGAVNFGHNEYCAYCYGKYGVKYERDSKESSGR